MSRVRYRAGTPKPPADPLATPQTEPRAQARTRTLTLVTGAAAAGVAACALLAACSSAPAQAPELSGVGNAGAGPGYQDTRITLPETVDLSFHHPQTTDRIEHEVLFTVQQALRAQLHAEYGTDNDPLLAVYWSGPALASARNAISGWIKKGEQPVGVLVVTSTDYTAPNTAGVAGVSYCASWADVVTGKSDTHVVGSAVQPNGTAGTYTTLSLTRADGHRWRVMSLNATAGSAHCPSTATH